MTFLAPALLAGLAAILVPIVVHLVQRERKRVVAFPSLMFLRKIPYQSVRRRAIRNWPLLLLRMLAFALIALAFARPFLPGAVIAGRAATGGRDVVIALDRSYSMAYGDHWDRARREARRVVQGLGPDDRAGLVSFTSTVQVEVQPTSDHTALLTAIDRMAPGSGATRYGPALGIAAGLFDPTTARARRELVLVSDFQKTGWDRSQGVKLPPGMTFRTIAVTDPDMPNVALAGLALEREASEGRDQVTVSARVVNRGAAAVTDREVALEVDGRRLGTARASIGPRAMTTVRLAPFPLPPGGRARLTVRLAPDALRSDDAFHAVVSATGRVPVLVLDSPNPDPDATLYLVRALGVAGEPGFDARLARVDRVTPQEIAGAAVVVLNDAVPPAGAAGRALEAGVRSGTGLFIALGQRSAWPTDAPDLLPGRLGDVTDRAGTHGGTLGFIDYSHPAFEIFRTPRSGGLTSARVFRYRQLAASSGVMARFDDGAVALAERRVGRGAVLAWTSTLDTYWNDLALKPVFVPFVHQAIKHLARYVDPKSWYTVGEVFDPQAVSVPGVVAAGNQEAAVVALTPRGEREAIGRAEGGQPSRAFVLADQGFYEFRAATARGGNGVVIAVNVDPAESDLSPLDPAELAASVTGSAPLAGQPIVREVTIEERERRQSLWWYLLAGGLLLLVTELVVANRLARIA
jgi:hypothetical protein